MEFLRNVIFSYGILTFGFILLPGNADASTVLDVTFDADVAPAATDVSGQGNHGTLGSTSALVVSTRTGNGQAMDVRGNQGVALFPELKLSGEQITVSAWINARSFPGSLRDPRIFSRASSNAVQGHEVMLGTIKSGNAIRLQFRLRVNGTTTTVIASHGARLGVNQWHHVAATYDGSAIRLYQDGEEVGSRGMSGAITSIPDIASAIGGQPFDRKVFNGLLDDVVVLSSALSKQQIVALSQRSQALRAGADVYNTVESQSLVVSAAEGVLANDTDSEGRPLIVSLVSGVSHGALFFQPDGAFRYEPADGFIGEDGFSYAVRNPNGVETTVDVTLNVNAAPSANPSLLVQLAFDGPGESTALDSGGSSNHGIIEGAVKVAETVDGSSGALQFDGANDFVTLPAIDGNSDGLTIAAWIKADRFPGTARDPRIVEKSSDGTNSGLYFSLTTLKVGSKTLPVFRARFGGSLRTLRAGAAHNMVPGEWYHLAATYDGHRTTLYVNGVHAVSQATQGDLAADSRIAVRIGGAINGKKFFDGLIDQVVMLNRALQATEVLTLASRAGDTPDDSHGDELDNESPAPTEMPDLHSGTPDGQPVSYQAVAQNAQPEFLLETDNEYLGEYLRQNPTVHWWHQDLEQQRITPLNEPQIVGAIINVEPGGEDDTDTILNAARQAGFGGMVLGNGQPFKVRLMRVTTPGVTFKNIPMEPYVGAGAYSVQVEAPDVRFINSPLDQKMKDFRYGFDLKTNADRFVMVNGGVSNKNNTRWGGGSLLHINEGVDDVYIVGNRFENSFSSHSGTTSRAIHYSSANYSGPTSQRGVIAVNHMENLQSRDYKEDADGFMASGFSQNNMFNGNLLFLGNVGINAGKRTIKALSGGIDAHGNFSWWRDRDGPLGTRVTWTHYDGLGVSKTRWTNNIAITDTSNPRSESYFMALQTHQFAAQYDTFDIVYKNNLYIHNDDTSEGRKSYVFRISDFDGSNTTDWPANSEISNNVIRGSGTVSFVWKYFGGNDPYGEKFKHENNLIELNFEAEYRPYRIR